MAEVILRQLTKHFGSVEAVEDVTLRIPDGEFLVLLGPSGCGKSTILRLIAGLEDATRGEILVDGELINFKDPTKRNVAMVFQNYALYPHMTVYKNVAFPLETARMAREEIAEAVQRAAEMLEIEALLKRLPEQLSGGQRQRVALARAIVRQPLVFLMDEPLSNLDAQLRLQTRLELMGLHERLGITTIYVTHDQVEAMTMGQRIAVMKDGRIQQMGDPTAVYDVPANTFVATFLGAPPMNLIGGSLVRDNGHVSFRIEGYELDRRSRGLRDQPRESRRSHRRCPAGGPTRAPDAGVARRRGSPRRGPLPGAGGFGPVRERGRGRARGAGADAARHPGEHRGRRAAGVRPGTQPHLRRRLPEPAGLSRPGSASEASPGRFSAAGAPHEPPPRPPGDAPESSRPPSRRRPAARTRRTRRSPPPTTQHAPTRV